MLKAMVFIDQHNFAIATKNYYKEKAQAEEIECAKSEGREPRLFARYQTPKLDYNEFPRKLVALLPEPHALIKTFLFAPKPDEFLINDPRRSGEYNWITGMKNQNRFTVIEGRLSARPVEGFKYNTMNLENRASFFCEEKGTDVNLAAHLITKGFLNAYDTAMVLSGDTDYLPVFDILNTLGRSVVVVGVKGQNLSRFKHHSDQQIIIKDDFFNSCLRT